MYAIIRTGGKQYRVSQGDSIRIERLDGQVGDEVRFDDVLMVTGDNGSQVGQEAAGVEVVGTISEQAKGNKVIVFKFKRRKMYRRKRGHRQLFTQVTIDRIGAGTGQDSKQAEKPQETAAEEGASQEADSGSPEDSGQE